MKSTIEESADLDSCPRGLAVPRVSIPALVLPPAADDVRRQRICHVSLGLSTGGLERLLVDFARFHDRRRFELHFVALRDVGRPAEEIRETGCAVHRPPRARRLGQIRSLAALFREIAPDVVHTHNAYPHFHGALAARWAKIPIVINTRHGQRFKQSAKARFQAWLAGRFTDRIIAVSDDAAGLCVSEDRIPARKVARIWNGIDLDRFVYSGPAAQQTAISVARLSPEKDGTTLLQAVRLASRLVPELRLMIVGDGNERRMLESLSRELRIFDRVLFLGERGDIPDLLAQSGFFVSASLTEGISLTLLEAMAVGLPVLTTSVGGNPEVVLDGVTGRLVPAGNADALAAGMVRMCREQDRWPDMGRAGRARVAEHFTVGRMVREYEDLYQSLVRQTIPRRG